LSPTRQREAQSPGARGDGHEAAAAVRPLFPSSRVPRIEVAGEGMAAMRLAAAKVAAMGVAMGVELEGEARAGVRVGAMVAAETVAGATEVGAKEAAMAVVEMVVGMAA